MHSRSMIFSTCNFRGYKFIIQILYERVGIYVTYGISPTINIEIILFNDYTLDTSFFS